MIGVSWWHLHVPGFATTEFIEDEGVIEKILRHLGLCETHNQDRQSIRGINGSPGSDNF